MPSDIPSKKSSEYQSLFPSEGLSRTTSALPTTTVLDDDYLVVDDYNVYDDYNV